MCPKQYLTLIALCLLLYGFACNSSKNTGNGNVQQKNTNTSVIPKPNTDPNPPPDYQPPKPQQELPNVGKDCVDLSKVKNPNEDCTFLWKPVCGCNGITYENECLARKAGVLKWTQGQCKN
ncbi:MAG TPA: Kazal-type serine protease inhibitor domain-containing protein [Chitinophagales bacterium]|nr:Kazal-type serine protease inhibitor domain-containing protein [Chitinophagales bacterium]HRK28515.1 Kazal-type serine protease inhibitor domain-containing protein [Chitinophagales bacterium]